MAYEKLSTILQFNVDDFILTHTHILLPQTDQVQVCGTVDAFGAQNIDVVIQTTIQPPAPQDDDEGQGENQDEAAATLLTTLIFPLQTCGLRKLLGYKLLPPNPYPINLYPTTPFTDVQVVADLATQQVQITGIGPTDRGVTFGLNIPEIVNSSLDVLIWVDEENLQYYRATMNGTMQLGSSSVPVAVYFPNEVTNWSIGLPADTETDLVGGWADLAALFNSASEAPATILPASLMNIGSYKLTDLFMTFPFGKATFSKLTLTAITDQTWQPIQNNALPVTNVLVYFQYVTQRNVDVSPLPSSYTGDIFGNITMLGKSSDITISLNQSSSVWTLVNYIDLGITSIGQINSLPNNLLPSGMQVEESLPPGINTLAGLNIDTVSVIFDIVNGSLKNLLYEISATGNWAVPGSETYTLEDMQIRLDVNTPSDESNQQVISISTGELQTGSPAPFMAAEKSDASESWTLEMDIDTLGNGLQPLGAGDDTTPITINLADMGAVVGLSTEQIQALLPGTLNISDPVSWNSANVFYFSNDVRYYSVINFDITNLWEILPNIIFAEINLGLRYDFPSPPDETANLCAISAHTIIAEIDFTFTGVNYYALNQWSLYGELAQDNDNTVRLNLGALIDWLKEKELLAQDFVLPVDLNQLNLSQAEIIITPDANTVSVTGGIQTNENEEHTSWQGQLGQLNFVVKNPQISLQIEAPTEEQVRPYTFGLTGQIEIAGIQCDISGSTSDITSNFPFTASIENAAGINLANLAQQLTNGANDPNVVWHSVLPPVTESLNAFGFAAQASLKLDVIVQSLLLDGVAGNDLGNLTFGFDLQRGYLVAVGASEGFNPGSLIPALMVVSTNTPASNGSLVISQQAIDSLYEVTQQIPDFATSIAILAGESGTPTDQSEHPVTTQAGGNLTSQITAFTGSVFENIPSIFHGIAAQPGFMFTGWVATNPQTSSFGAFLGDYDAESVNGLAFSGMQLLFRVSIPTQVLLGGTTKLTLWGSEYPFTGNIQVLASTGSADLNQSNAIAIQHNDWIPNVGFANNILSIRYDFSKSPGANGFIQLTINGQAQIVETYPGEIHFLGSVPVLMNISLSNQQSALTLAQFLSVCIPATTLNSNFINWHFEAGSIYYYDQQSAGNPAAYQSYRAGFNMDTRSNLFDTPFDLQLAGYDDGLAGSSINASHHNAMDLGFIVLAGENYSGQPLLNLSVRGTTQSAILRTGFKLLNEAFGVTDATALLNGSGNPQVEGIVAYQSFSIATFRQTVLHFTYNEEEGLKIDRWAFNVRAEIDYEDYINGYKAGDCDELTKVVLDKAVYTDFYLLPIIRANNSQMTFQLNGTYVITLQETGEQVVVVNIPTSFSLTLSPSDQLSALPQKIIDYLENNQAQLVLQLISDPVKFGEFIEIVGLKDEDTGEEPEELDCYEEDEDEEQDQELQDDINENQLSEAQDLSDLINAIETALEAGIITTGIIATLGGVVAAVAAAVAASAAIAELAADALAIAGAIGVGALVLGGIAVGAAAVLLLAIAAYETVNQIVLAFGDDDPEKETLATPVIQSLTITNNSMRLEWNAVENADVYRIEARSGSTVALSKFINANGSGSQSATLDLTPLAAGSFTVFVIATSYNYNSSVSLPEIIEKLAPVSDLTLQYDSGATQLLATWDATTSPAGYQVELYRDSGRISSIQVNQASASFAADSLIAGRYTVQVQVRGQANSVASVWVTGASAVTKLADPQITHFAYADNQLLITLGSAVDGASSYTFSLSDDQDNIIQLGETNLLNNAFALPSSFPAAVYTAQAQALGDNTQIIASRKTRSSDTVSVLAPPAVTLIAYADSQITVTVNGVTGANALQVQLVGTAGTVGAAVAVDLNTLQAVLGVGYMAAGSYHIQTQALASDTQHLSSVWEISGNALIQLAAPADVQTNLAPESITVTWTGSGAPFYLVQLVNTDSGSVTVINSATVDDTSYTFPLQGINFGACKASVQAVDPANTLAIPSQTIFSAETTLQLPAPSISSATYVPTSNNVRVMLANVVSETVSYQVRMLNSLGEVAVDAVSVNPASSSALLPLPDSADPHFTVQAQAVSLNQSALNSVWSELLLTRLTNTTVSDLSYNESGNTVAVSLTSLEAGTTYEVQLLSNETPLLPTVLSTTSPVDVHVNQLAVGDCQAQVRALLSTTPNSLPSLWSNPSDALLTIATAPTIVSAVSSQFTVIATLAQIDNYEARLIDENQAVVSDSPTVSNALQITVTVNDDFVGSCGLIVRARGDINSPWVAYPSLFTRLATPPITVAYNSATDKLNITLQSFATAASRYTVTSLQDSTVLDTQTITPPNNSTALTVPNSGEGTIQVQAFGSVNTTIASQPSLTTLTCLPLPSVTTLTYSDADQAVIIGIGGFTAGTTYQVQLISNGAPIIPIVETSTASASIPVNLLPAGTCQARVRALSDATATDIPSAWSAASDASLTRLAAVPITDVTTANDTVSITLGSVGTYEAVLLQGTNRVSNLGSIADGATVTVTVTDDLVGPCQAFARTIGDVTTIPSPWVAFASMLTRLPAPAFHVVQYVIDEDKVQATLTATIASQFTVRAMSGDTQTDQTDQATLPDTNTTALLAIAASGAVTLQAQAWFGNELAIASVWTNLPLTRLPNPAITTPLTYDETLDQVNVVLDSTLPNQRTEVQLLQDASPIAPVIVTSSNVADLPITNLAAGTSCTAQARVVPNQGTSFIPSEWAVSTSSINRLAAPVILSVNVSAGVATITFAQAPAVGSVYEVRVPGQAGLPSSITTSSATAQITIPTNNAGMYVIQARATGANAISSQWVSSDTTVIQLEAPTILSAQYDLNNEAINVQLQSPVNGASSYQAILFVSESLQSAPPVSVSLETLSASVPMLTGDFTGAFYAKANASGSAAGSIILTSAWAQLVLNRLTAPIIATFAYANNIISLTWTGSPNQTYQVQLIDDSDQTVIVGQTVSSPSATFTLQPQYPSSIRARVRAISGSSATDMPSAWALSANSLTRLVSPVISNIICQREDGKVAVTLTGMVNGLVYHVRMVSNLGTVISDDVVPNSSSGIATLTLSDTFTGVCWVQARATGNAQTMPSVWVQSDQLTRLAAPVLRYAIYNMSTDQVIAALSSVQYTTQVEFVNNSTATALETNTVSANATETRFNMSDPAFAGFAGDCTVQARSIGDTPASMIPSAWIRAQQPMTRLQKPTDVQGTPVTMTNADSFVNISWAGIYQTDDYLYNIQIMVQSTATAMPLGAVGAYDTQGQRFDGGGFSVPLPPGNFQAMVQSAILIGKTVIASEWAVAPQIMHYAPPVVTSATYSTGAQRVTVGWTAGDGLSFVIQVLNASNRLVQQSQAVFTTNQPSYSYTLPANALTAQTYKVQIYAQSTDALHMSSDWSAGRSFTVSNPPPAQYQMLIQLMYNGAVLQLPNTSLVFRVFLHGSTTPFDDVIATYKPDIQAWLLIAPIGAGNYDIQAVLEPNSYYQFAPGNYIGQITNLAASIAPTVAQPLNCVRILSMSSPFTNTTLQQAGVVSPVTYYQRHQNFAWTGYLTGTSYTLRIVDSENPATPVATTTSPSEQFAAVLNSLPENSYYILSITGTLNSLSVATLAVMDQVKNYAETYQFRIASMNETALHDYQTGMPAQTACNQLMTDYADVYQGQDLCNQVATAMALAGYTSSDTMSALLAQENVPQFNPGSSKVQQGTLAGNALTVAYSQNTMDIIAASYYVSGQGSSTSANEAAQDIWCRWSIVGPTSQPSNQGTITAIQQALESAGYSSTVSQAATAAINPSLC